MSRLASKIEAILYLKAQPLKIAQIAEFAQCDRETAEEGLIELMGEYAHREGALEIAETEEGYALQLRELYKPLVDTIVPLDIGLGALRTLAAIALRGPIAQNELVDIRGSGVYQHVPDLVEQGFVKKRRQADGRSSWLQVTEKFYQHFEIDKLPQIESLRLPKQKELLPEEGSEVDVAKAVSEGEVPVSEVPVGSETIDGEAVDGETANSETANSETVNSETAGGETDSDDVSTSEMSTAENKTV
ncbi:MAG: SMC-Scp complex subunit ScpB [Cyanobacteria bacterium J06649_4]